MFLPGEYSPPSFVMPGVGASYVTPIGFEAAMPGKKSENEPFYLYPHYRSSSVGQVKAVTHFTGGQLHLIVAIRINMIFRTSVTATHPRTMALLSRDIPVNTKSPVFRRSIRSCILPLPQ